MKFPIGLVAYCSIHQATQVTNARAKANTATKMLQIVKIASIFYTRNISNHRTLKTRSNGIIECCCEVLDL